MYLVLEILTRLEKLQYKYIYMIFVYFRIEYTIGMQKNLITPSI